MELAPFIQHGDTTSERARALFEEYVRVKYISVLENLYYTVWVSFDLEEVYSYIRDMGGRSSGEFRIPYDMFQVSVHKPPSGTSATIGLWCVPPSPEGAGGDEFAYRVRSVHTGADRDDEALALAKIYEIEKYVYCAVGPSEGEPPRFHSDPNERMLVIGA